MGNLTGGNYYCNANTLINWDATNHWWLIDITNVQGGNGLYQYNRYCLYYPDTSTTTFWCFHIGWFLINALTGLVNNVVEYSNCTITYSTYISGSTMYVRCVPSTLPGLSQQLRYKTLVC